jgi:hypothetical protein
MPGRRRVYCEWKATMAAENLADLISSLTPEERKYVRQFVEVLKSKGSSQSSTFLTAADEFIDQHPELLRRLAHSGRDPALRKHCPKRVSARACNVG